MDSTVTRRLAAALLAATAVLHLALAPEYLDEETYVGVLFVLAGVAGLVLSALLWRRSDPLAWTGGAMLAAGMGAGFVLSRTTGLPSFHESEWEGSGLLSLALEAGFLCLAAVAVRARPRRAAQSAP